MKSLKKLISDTLQPNGKWSMKRIGAFTSFWIAIVYAFTPIFSVIEIKEFVFVGLLTYSATSIGLTVWNKKIKQDENEEH
jgi:hypothetical protein